MSDAWTTKLAATRRLLDELRVDVASSSREEDGNTNHQRHDAERARATALARRKLNRLDDLLDILEDCASDGDASEEERRARARGRCGSLGRRRGGFAARRRGG